MKLRLNGSQALHNNIHHLEAFSALSHSAFQMMGLLFAISENVIWFHDLVFYIFYIIHVKSCCFFKPLQNPVEHKTWLLLKLLNPTRKKVKRIVFIVAILPHHPYRQHLPDCLFHQEDWDPAHWDLQTEKPTTILKTSFGFLLFMSLCIRFWGWAKRWLTYLHVKCIFYFLLFSLLLGLKLLISLDAQQIFKSL